MLIYGNRTITGLNAEGQRYTPAESPAGANRTITGLNALGQRYIPTGSAAGRSIPLQQAFTGSGVVSPRAGITAPLPSLSGAVFGGTNGGGGITTPTPNTIGASTLTGLGSSVSKAGVSITNTLGSYIPLAIKVVLAVVVLKIVLWLIKGRRR